MGNKNRLVTILLIITMIMGSAATSAYAGVFRYASKVEKKLFSTENLTDYVVPDTPSFDEDKGENEFVTIKERKAYVEKLAEENPYMYVFYKKNRQDTPVVFFTAEDLSSAGNPEEAAALLHGSEKVNVLYHGQLHGNEPAAGEGPLYFLSRLNGEKGEAIAADINLCVVPCVNPEGSRLKIRDTAKDGYNINRDNLYVGSAQTLLLHEIYNAFMPEVTLDSHECVSNMQLAPGKTSDYFTDVYIAGTSNINIDSRINRWSDKLRDSALEGCKEAGLRVSIYDNYLTCASNVVSRTYYGLYGSISVLIESMGINMGHSHFERRTFSHYKAVDSILAMVIEEKEAIKTVVADVRRELADSAGVFGELDKFALEQTYTGDEYITVKRNVYNSATGAKVSTEKYKIYQFDKAKRERTLPTAYIISKSEKNADRIIKKLRYNGIEYFELEEGTKLKMSTFSGDGEKAKVTKKKMRTFSKGAYVIPMDQYGALVIASCLEPDIAETLKWEGTYVQAGLIDADKIYRYTIDNPRGSLEKYMKKDEIQQEEAV